LRNRFQQRIFADRIQERTPGGVEWGLGALSCLVPPLLVVIGQIARSGITGYRLFPSALKDTQAESTNSITGCPALRLGTHRSTNSRHQRNHPAGTHTRATA